MPPEGTFVALLVAIVAIACALGCVRAIASAFENELRRQRLLTRVRKLEAERARRLREPAR